MQVDAKLIETAAAHPRPLLFATISGAHLYGFPSADSDFDLRGAHVLPLREVVGLVTHMETIERGNQATAQQDGLELDIVTHDIKKFITMLLKKNGYVLEQLLSPLVVYTTPQHDELKSLAPGCITRHHSHHYLGFAHTEWKLFEKEHPRRVKPLLYVYRVLMTGIHLMRTGEVECNIMRLNEEFRLPFIPDLVAQKTGGPEQGACHQPDADFHHQQVERLTGLLRTAHETSALPDLPTARPALEDLLLRVRMATLNAPDNAPPAKDCT